MKMKLIDKLSAILGDSIEKPKMHFNEQHKCLIENLLSPVTTQYNFFAGGDSIDGKSFNKGYIVINCKTQVDAAISSLLEQRKLLSEVYNEITAHDTSASRADKLIGSAELKQLMQTSGRHQAEAKHGFHDEYKLDCYTKASEFSADDVSLAMHRCDAIYQDICTKYDADITAMRQAAGFETNQEL